jgi:C4-dicarboxylate-specific signal transduction histidine kinase
MGELAATIAHEVNQPLTAIVTNGQFCLRRLDGATTNLHDLRPAITEIVNDGTRASAVISRIRGLLAKTSDRTELDINQVIQDVTSLLRNEFTRNRVLLHTKFATDLPRVLGDSVQLQQVLINLIMNAIEATRTSANRRREVLIRSAKNPDSVLVQVQDSGPGIEPGLANRIFEPFFTTKAKGVGMGLSISHSIIESHGGRLGIVSSSTGALFEFTLPTDGAGV